MSILSSFSRERGGGAGAGLLAATGRAAVLEVIWAGAAGAVVAGAANGLDAAGAVVAPPPNKAVGPAGAVGFAGAPAGAGVPKSPPPGAGGFPNILIILL